MSLARPKSQILTTLLSESKTFLAARSLWIHWCRSAGITNNYDKFLRLSIYHECANFWLEHISQTLREARNSIPRATWKLKEMRSSRYKGACDAVFGSGEWRKDTGWNQRVHLQQLVVSRPLLYLLDWSVLSHQTLTAWWNLAPCPSLQPAEMGRISRGTVRMTRIYLTGQTWKLKRIVGLTCSQEHMYVYALRCETDLVQFEFREVSALSKNR